MQWTSTRSLLCETRRMARYDDADERFGHQIPEPFRNTALHHRDWRESLFFVMQPTDRLGDVFILTLANFPARNEMDSLQLGRCGDTPIFARYSRHCDGDHDDWTVGPVQIDIVEPRKTIRLRVQGGTAPDGSVAPGGKVPLAMDVTFSARVQPYQLRRGTMKAGDEVVWDQSHMFQSGWYDGTVTHAGETITIDKWWGQRDHSWGIRTHYRCPMWMWLAIHVPEGMLAVWCWELPNGARVYTDGCLSPSDGGPPVAVREFRHDLTWLDHGGNPISYERHGENVNGLAGKVDFVLENGRSITVEATGRWAQRYDAFNPGTTNSLGGGLNEMLVTTSDGQRGTAIYEVTGAWHHRYFPLPRGERLPPDGATPGMDQRI
jgi:hypothetical protein